MMSNFMEHDNQREFISQFLTEILLEQKSYLLEHPEIKLMLKRYIAQITYLRRTPIEVLKHAALYFTRPVATLQEEIKMKLKIPRDSTRIFSYKFDKAFDYEHENIDKAKVDSTDDSTSHTNTSSFMSILTSASTLMTPDFVQDLEQTTSQLIRDEVVHIVNMAVLFKVTEEDFQYDFAYVEVLKAVEVAMEIPVIEIRNDVIELLRMAYYVFESEIAEKERMEIDDVVGFINKPIALSCLLSYTCLYFHFQATQAIHQRTKKYSLIDLWQTGYETLQTAGSEVSPHETLAMESDKFQVQYRFNRYPKDRFGIYLPRAEVYELTSITMSPEVSATQLVEPDNDQLKYECYVSTQ